MFFNSCANDFISFKETDYEITFSKYISNSVDVDDFFTLLDFKKETMEKYKTELKILQILYKKKYLCSNYLKYEILKRMKGDNND